MTYLSEVMLQQTTVMTVENKLKSYLKEFPDFRSYKNKDLSDVLNSWSGLGYYKRAENLFRSVEIINEKYDGKLLTTDLNDAATELLFLIRRKNKYKRYKIDSEGLKTEL